jgi:hypothetical protein
MEVVVRDTDIVIIAAHRASMSEVDAAGPLTLDRGEAYNDDAFQRCKSLIMNKFGAPIPVALTGLQLRLPDRFRSF